MSTNRTLIVLPGWGHDASHWQSFAARFDADTIRVIELPGFGKEPLVSSAWGVPEYATWAQEKIESLGLQNVVLLGHSFGGRTAAVIASKNPHWLKGVIFYASPLLYRPSSFLRLRIRFARFLSPFFPESFKKRFRNGSDQSEAKKTGLEEILKKVIPFDAATILPEVTVPTLFLLGERDAYPRVALGEEAMSLIPNARLEVLKGAGHNAHLERPELFYGHVKKFIETL